MKRKLVEDIATEAAFFVRVGVSVQKTKLEQRLLPNKDKLVLITFPIDMVVGHTTILTDVA